MKPVIVHSGAKRELAKARVCYEERCEGLGLDFLTEVEAATEKLRQNPHLCPRYKRTAFRKQFVERFPYLIFFLELPDYFWIAAIAHGRRRAGYWKRRKPKETRPS